LKSPNKRGEIGDAIFLGRSPENFLENCGLPKGNILKENCWPKKKGQGAPKKGEKWSTCVICVLFHGVWEKPTKCERELTLGP